jgi:transposase-like protein
LTYCFTRQFSYEQALIETSLDEEITSSETIADWYSYCRELTIVGLDRLYEGTGKIGGPGHIIEIDESKIGKRKYNVGRIVEGQWLLGILDLGTLENPTRKYRIEILPNNQRDGETLLRLINRHVEKESTIVTDCWRGYNGLDADGFNHLTVNHTYNFVDPDTFAHTQTIESSWRALKKRILRGGVRKQNLADHLCEYLWRTEMINKKKDFFEGFLEEIRQVFLIRGEPEVIVLD